MNAQFTNPFASILFILPILLFLYYYGLFVFKKQPRLLFSNQISFENRSQSNFILQIRSNIIFLLQLSSLLFLIYASMGPYKVRSITSANIYGIDIVIALDASESMLANDFKPGNRFIAAKKIIKDFIEKRNNDRLGLVLFGSDAYVQSPQTTEYDALLSILDSLEIGSIDYRSTAVGQALAVSASRLIDSKAKSKIILLVTDGSETANKINPEVVIEAIKELDIKVYTLGIGSENSRYAVDFTLLEKIAKSTGGIFYRSRSAAEFASQMNEIDRLEKSLTNKKRYQHKDYVHTNYIWYGFILLLISIAIEFLFWKVRP